MTSLVTDNTANNNNNNNNVGKCSLTKPSWPRRKGNDKVYIQGRLKKNRNFSLGSNILNELTNYKDMVDYVNNSINMDVSKIEDKVQKDGANLNEYLEQNLGSLQELDIGSNHHKIYDQESRIREHLSDKFVKTYNDPRCHYETSYYKKQHREPLRCFKQKQIKPRKCAEDQTAHDVGYCLEIFVKDFMNANGCPECKLFNCFVDGGTLPWGDCICMSKVCQGKTFIEAKSKYKENDINQILKNKQKEAGSYMQYVKQHLAGVENHYLFLLSNNFEQCGDSVYLMKIKDIHPCINDSFCADFTQSGGKRGSLKSMVEWDIMKSIPLNNSLQSYPSRKDLLEAITFAKKTCNSVKDINYAEKETQLDLEFRKKGSIGIKFTQCTHTTGKVNFTYGTRGNCDDSERKKIAIGDEIEIKGNRNRRPLKIHVRRTRRPLKIHVRRTVLEKRQSELKKKQPVSSKNNENNRRNVNVTENVLSDLAKLSIRTTGRQHTNRRPHQGTRNRSHHGRSHHDSSYHDSSYDDSSYHDSSYDDYSRYENLQEHILDRYERRNKYVRNQVSLKNSSGYDGHQRRTKRKGKRDY